MIKKVLSISAIVLMLTAIFNISVATHYCGGMIASTKVSLSGELATCGMEQDKEQSPVAESTFSSHCCDNTLRFYGINGSYFPTFTFVQESFQTSSQIFDIPVDLCRTILISGLNLSSKRPPGLVSYGQVDLAEICTFRI